MTKVYDTATDLITFARSSSGTALRRVGYGDELVTNGGFDTDTSGWAASAATLSVVSNKLRITNSGANYGYAWQSLTTEVGKTYVYSLDYTVGTSSTASMRVGTAQGGSQLGNITLSASGSHSITFTATTTTSYILVLNLSPTDALYTDIDNISVKEVIFDRATDPLVLYNHPDGMPRIEYAADGSLKGLLIEEERSNLVTHSDFSSGWGTFDVSLDPSAVVSPDGKTDALKLVEGSGSSIHRTNGQSITVSSGVKYTASVYAKAGERSNVLLRTYNGSVDEDTYFDLSSGAVVSGTGSVEDIGNGWFRLSRTVTATATTSSAYIVQLLLCSAGTTTSYQGDGTSGIYLWGFQLEAGSFATSYIPTSGSQSTRSPDIASIPVSAFGYNQDAGTVVVEAQKFALLGGTMVNICDGGSGGSVQRMQLRFQPTALQSIFAVNGVANGFTSVSNSLNANTFYRAAWSFDGPNSLVTAGEGGVSSPDTSHDVPAPVEMRIGRLGQTGNPVQSVETLNGHIKSIQYFPRRLTNAQLQELTA